MKKYTVVQLKYADGHKEYSINESEPIYFIHREFNTYKCCNECWMKE